MGEGIGELYMLNTCPFTWKVRALLDHLDLPHKKIQINPMKIKKSVAFAGDWGKTILTINNITHEITALF